MQLSIVGSIMHCTSGLGCTTLPNTYAEGFALWCFSFWLWSMGGPWANFSATDDPGNALRRD